MLGWVDMWFGGLESMLISLGYLQIEVLILD
jgi:hypothetical protein